jgi:hypothetical protein
LIGAPALQRATEGEITVVTGNGIDQISPLVFESYTPALEHFQRFFPEAEQLTVFAMDLPSANFFDGDPATQESLVATISPRDLNWVGRSPQSAYTAIGANIVDSLFGGQENALTSNISYFLWIHYMANGDPEEMGALLRGGLPNNGGSRTFYSIPYEERYRIAFALYDVVVTEGEDAMIDLLRQMYAQRDTLSAGTPEAIMAWIEEARSAD